MFQVSDPNRKTHNCHIWSHEYYTPNITFTVHGREKINGRRLFWQQCPFCRGSWGNTPNKWWQECGKDSLVYLLFIFWICWCGWVKARARQLQTGRQYCYCYRHGYCSVSHRQAESLEREGREGGPSGTNRPPALQTPVHVCLLWVGAQWNKNTSHLKGSLLLRMHQLSSEFCWYGNTDSMETQWKERPLTLKLQ